MRLSPSTGACRCSPSRTAGWVYPHRVQGDSEQLPGLGVKQQVHQLKVVELTVYRSPVAECLREAY